MLQTSQNETLTNISRYIEKQVDTEKLNIIIAQLQKLDLFISTIKEALFAYAMLNPSVISDAFYQQLQRRLSKPQRKLIPFIKKRQPKYITPEDKEVDYILSLIEDEEYHDIHDLESTLDSYFPENGNDNPHKKDVVDFIMAALSAYYECILKPEVDYHADLNRKKLVLLTCIDKAVNFFIANRGRNYLEPSNILKTRIRLIPTEHELHEFVDAWLEKRKLLNHQDPINLQKFKHSLPKRLKTFLDRELNQYRNKHLIFGEFFVNEKTTFTLVDFIQFALDKYRDEIGLAIKPTSKKLIDEIAVLLKNNDLTDEQMIDSIRKLFKKKLSLPFFPNRLNRYCLDNIKAYNRIIKTLAKKQKKLKKPALKFSKQGNLIQIPQVFITKQLRPLDTMNQKSIDFDKILLLIHGWRDNKVIMAKLSEEARKQGYLVINYYQKSLIDNINFFKKIQLNPLRRNFRLFLSHIVSAYPNSQFTIYSQGISANIPLCEKSFIQKMHAINNIILDSPAIAHTRILPKNIGLAKKQSPLKRLSFKFSRSRDITSASALKVFCSIPTLLKSMRQARLSLNQLVYSNQTEANTQWQLIFCRHDHAANHKMIQMLENKLSENEKIGIEILPLSNKQCNDPQYAKIYLDKILENLP